jgi:hypothetical protein
MRQPSTHYIREFVNRGQRIHNNSVIFDKETIINVTRELTDLLAHFMELQNQIAELKEQIENTQVLTVELVGENF